MFPPDEIVKYYKIYHTFDVEEASERMMENINYLKEEHERMILNSDYEELKQFTGNVIGIVIRENDIVDILIVSNKNYTVKKRNKWLNFKKIL